MNTYRKTIWLIDDNEIDNFINKKTILKNNFSEVVKDFNSATSAESELDKLLANPQDAEQIPAFIFLDLNMPVYSGIEFVKRCENKLLQLNPGIKIVVLTSSINPNDEYTASLFSTFFAYINKPLNPDNLMKLQLML